MSSIGFYFDMSKIVEDKAKAAQRRQDIEGCNKYLREMRALYNRNRGVLRLGITDNIPEVYR